MIVGITGSFGAGKGAVVDYLVQEKGFKNYSASGFITEEIVRRQMPVNRDSMIVVANDLRAKFGPTFIIDSLYERAKDHGKNSIIESLRAIAEVQRIKELGGIVLGIDADPQIRYERAFARGSEKDHVNKKKQSLILTTKLSKIYLVRLKNQMS
jgi:dephospho-CoA kinase